GPRRLLVCALPFVQGRLASATGAEPKGRRGHGTPSRARGRAPLTSAQADRVEPLRRRRNRPPARWTGLGVVHRGQARFRAVRPPYWTRPGHRTGGRRARCGNGRFHGLKLSALGCGSVAYNLDAEPEILTWLAGRRIDAIAFNDHMSGTVDASSRAQQLAQMVARAGVTRERFLAV